eukprot:tig00021312_g20065.t1
MSAMHKTAAHAGVGMSAGRFIEAAVKAEQAKTPKSPLAEDTKPLSGAEWTGFYFGQMPNLFLILSGIGTMVMVSGALYEGEEACRSLLNWTSFCSGVICAFWVACQSGRGLLTIVDEETALLSLLGSEFFRLIGVAWAYSSFGHLLADPALVAALGAALAALAAHAALRFAGRDRSDALARATHWAAYAVFWAEWVGAVAAGKLGARYVLTAGLLTFAGLYRVAGRERRNAGAAAAAAPGPAASSSSAKKTNSKKTS